MMCGNCHQQHLSAAEVKVCHGIGRQPTSTPRDANPDPASNTEPARPPEAIGPRTAMGKRSVTRRPLPTTLPPNPRGEFTSSRYAGSSTVSKAPKAEAAARSVCDCGVFVAAGSESMHDCG